MTKRSGKESAKSLGNSEKSDDNHRRSQHPHPTAIHKHDSLEDDRKQQSTDQKEAASLLRQAPQLLKQVEESYLLQHHRRTYPTFHSSEVCVGPLLGVGGFGVVFEVENLTLLPEKECDQHDAPPSEESLDKSKEREESGTVAAVDNHDQPSHRRKASEVSFRIPNSQSEGKKEGPHDTDDSHYDVRSARRHMVQFVRRDGDARYAIKRLHKDLPELARARGQIDLAIEAAYLSGLWHPNIVKMRAVAEGNPLDRHFFIIMDRLYDTLDVRIKQWKERRSKCKGNLFGIGADKTQLYQLTVERLTVAYDLAAALSYMHANKLVYRDLKQQNIGFDVRGDVKVFDFGLAKSVNDEVKAKDEKGRPIYGYNLTPRTGSLPYLSPENVKCLPYDEKSDVFSFAILFWEMLALKQAFKGFTRRDYLVRVVNEQERPRIGWRWPMCAPIVLREAWNDDPRKRPTMKRVATLIRGDLNELCQDDSVTHRSIHMRNRSAHSAHLRMLLENGIDDEDE